MKKQYFIEDKKGFANLVPMVLAIVITFALLFIGAYVNGTIHTELDNSAGDNLPSRNSMNNTSANFDSTIDIVQVVIIITVLAAAIGAIFLFNRFG